jgi:hypothetical protein
MVNEMGDKICCGYCNKLFSIHETHVCEGIYAIDGETVAVELTTNARIKKKEAWERVGTLGQFADERFDGIPHEDD